MNETVSQPQDSSGFLMGCLKTETKGTRHMRPSPRARGDQNSGALHPIRGGHRRAGALHGVDTLGLPPGTYAGGRAHRRLEAGRWPFLSRVISGKGRLSVQVATARGAADFCLFVF